MLQKLGNQNGNVVSVPPTEEEAKKLQREIDVLDDRVTNVENDISDLQERACCDEADIAQNTQSINDLSECINSIASDFDQIEPRVSCNEADIANLKQCPGLNCTGNVVHSDIEDFATCEYVHTAIESCGYTTCTGTLVPSDLDEICANISCLQSCPGLNCTGTVVQSDIENFIDCTCVKDIINVCCYATQSYVDDVKSRVCNNEESIAQLQSCPGLNCTGTLVESDLDDYATKVCVHDIIDSCGYATQSCVDSVKARVCTNEGNIGQLQSCPGLDCTGTLTEQDIADMETCTHAASTYATITCVDTEKARINNLESCPGLDCVGTLVASDIADMETCTHASATYATKTCVEAEKVRICQNEADIADLKTCPGLDCTGTVVQSDIEDFITMPDVDACGYTTCTGTVTSVNNVSPVNGNVTIVIPPDLSDQVTRNTNDIAAIKEKIPDAASSSNQLADKNWVNSSIETATATFVGTFDDVESLPTTGVDNNDYAFVTSCDVQTGSISYTRYKYSDYTHSWTCEYTINTSGFTADQLAALNSGITDELVDKITDVYDSTVTLCFNGTCKGSFNLNQSTDSCIDLGSTIACATNATCFNGCTYSQAKTDIRSGLVTQACLAACGYTTCTGTLVPSDLDDINTDITNLKSCAGLDCTGTVSSISLNGNNFTVNNGAATLTNFKPVTAGTADKANYAECLCRRPTSCNKNYHIPLTGNIISTCEAYYYVDSDGKLTYNPSTNILTAPVIKVGTCYATATQTCAYKTLCFYKCNNAGQPTVKLLAKLLAGCAHHTHFNGTVLRSRVGGYDYGSISNVVMQHSCWCTTSATAQSCTLVYSRGAGSPAAVPVIVCYCDGCCYLGLCMNSGDTVVTMTGFYNGTWDTTLPQICYCSASSCWPTTISFITCGTLDGVIGSASTATCAEKVKLATYAGCCDRPIMIACGATTYEQIGKSTCCPLTYNPATGEIKGIQEEVIGSASGARTHITPGEFEIFDNLPYIDLHYCCYCGDYSTRLIDNAQGQASLIVNDGTGTTDCTQNATYKFCSNGVLQTPTLCLSRHRIGSPFGATRYAKITFSSTCSQVLHFNVYNNEIFVQTHQCNNKTVLICAYRETVPNAYGVNCVGVSTDDNTCNYIWIRYSGYRDICITSCNPILSIDIASTEPENVTWCCPGTYEATLLGSSNSSRPTTANCEFPSQYNTGNVTLNLIQSSSSMTACKPIGDGYIAQFNWDNCCYKTQLYIPFLTNSNTPFQVRTKYNGTWGTAWCNLGCFVGTVCCAINACQINRFTCCGDVDLPLPLFASNTQTSEAKLWVTCADCPQITYNPSTGTLNGKNLSFNNITGCLTRATSSTEPVFEIYADECYDTYISCIKQTPEGISLCSIEVGDWCTNIDLSSGQLSITSMNNGVVGLFCMSPEERLICLAGCCVRIDSNTTIWADLCVTGTLYASNICGSTACAYCLCPKETCTTTPSSNPYSLLLIDKNAACGYWQQPTVQPDNCIECCPQFITCTTLHFDMCCKQLVTNNICAYCNVDACCSNICTSCVGSLCVNCCINTCVSDGENPYLRIDKYNCLYTNVGAGSITKACYKKVYANDDNSDRSCIVFMTCTCMDTGWKPGVAGLKLKECDIVKILDEHFRDNNDGFDASSTNCIVAYGRCGCFSRYFSHAGIQWIVNNNNKYSCWIDFICGCIGNYYCIHLGSSSGCYLRVCYSCTTSSPIVCMLLVDNFGLYKNKALWNENYC